MHVEVENMLERAKCHTQQQASTDLDLPHSSDEVDAIFVVLLYAGGNSQDVGIKDDVIGVEVQPVHQQPIGPCADLHLVLDRSGLARGEWAMSNKQ